VVAGVSLGNEQLFSKRSDFAGLTAVIASVAPKSAAPAVHERALSHLLPQSAAALLGELDFLLVNVHPIFQPWFRDAPDSTARSSW